MKKILALAALAAAGVSAHAATVIHAGRLIDVDASEVLTERSIVIENDEIVAVEAGYVDGDTVIDVSRPKSGNPSLCPS